MARVGTLLVVLASLGMSGAGLAQETFDLGRPPPSGFQNPVLPPPSGSQNPVLPPPSGQRYGPGIGGPFGEEGRRPVIPSPYPGVDQGLSGSVSPATGGFQGDLVDRLSDIGPALRRCWEPPLMAGPTDGAMATVRFSLRRNGTLFGQPRVTWETRRSNPDLQAAFTTSILNAVRNCTPMRLSPRFGASIAGRPFTIRFHGRAPSNERPT